MKIINKFYFVITGVISFIIYLFTLAPSVIQIDTGELAAVQATLGIAHPTGYPLYTMLGYLFSKIPLPFSTIYQLNLLAAIYCAFAVSIITYTSKVILDNLNIFQFIKKESVSKKAKSSKKKEVQKSVNINLISNLSDEIKVFAAMIAGLSLAFSKTFWLQSTSVEVYSLHLLLISLIILLLVKAYLVESDPRFNLQNLWIIFAGVLALGFTNHMTTLLIIPGVAYLYFDKNRFNKKTFKQIAVMLVIFLPILLLIYTYLPIRAAQTPLLNWGNPIDFERIFRHISGFQYQVWLFSSSEAAQKNLDLFFTNLILEFSITLIVIAIGIVYSFLKARKLFIFLLITFLFTVFYSINYDISDIDSYFLLAHISLAFFGLIGVVAVLLEFSKKRKTLLLSSAVLLAIIVFQAYYSFAEVDKSEVHIYEDYTKALMQSVEKDAVILSYQWDYFLSASYYFQFVENYRRDIAIIDKELLRRSWYYVQLETAYPNILSGIKSDVNSFLEAIKPFERKGNFNSNLLETLFRRIQTGLIFTNITSRDFYIGPELVDGEIQRRELSLPEGYFLVPHLFLFKVTNDQKYIAAPEPDFEIRIPEIKDKYVAGLTNIIGSMLARRAFYELQYNKVDMAKRYVKKIAADFPDYKIPPQLSNLLMN